MRQALAIPPERIEKLKERIVPIRNKNGKNIGEVQLKRGQQNIAKKGYVTVKEAVIINGNSSTGMKPEIRIKTLIKDLEIDTFKIIDKNIDMVKELIKLLQNAVKEFENE